MKDAEILDNRKRWTSGRKGKSTGKDVEGNCNSPIQNIILQLL